MSVDHTRNIIEVRGVSFRYGASYVVEDVSLCVHKGDYLGVIGPNGGGKTTLLKIMLGLVKPEGGEVKLFDREIAKFDEWWKIGYVPQKVVNFDLNFPATVFEVVSMGRFGIRGLFRKLGKDDIRVVDEALTQVEMFGYRDRIIGDLSQGQQQRVFIARALAAQPEVVFLDEPVAGVDAPSQDKFYDLLKKLNKELGLTLVFVSHDIESVVKDVTEVAFVNKKLTYSSNPELFVKHDLGRLYGEKMIIRSGHKA